MLYALGFRVGAEHKTYKYESIILQSLKPYEYIAYFTQFKLWKLVNS